MRNGTGDYLHLAVLRMGLYGLGGCGESAVELSKAEPEDTERGYL